MPSPSLRSRFSPSAKPLSLPLAPGILHLGPCTCGCNCPVDLLFGWALPEERRPLASYLLTAVHVPMLPRVVIQNAGRGVGMAVMGLMRTG